MTTVNVIHPKRFRNYVLAAICVSVISAAVAAQNLVLDSSFNPNASEIAPQNYVSAVQPDGKILVGGLFDFVNGSALSGLVRLSADGSLDTSFNSGGTGLNGSVHTIALLDEGKILIGGDFTHYNGLPVPRNLVRLNPDGTNDTTFNAGGAGVTVGSGTARVTSFAFQPDGKIVVSCQGASGYNGISSNNIFRINLDGTLDTSFISGFASASADQIEEVAIQSDGKIVIALDQGSHFYKGVQVGNLVRINSDATLDTEFLSFGGASGPVYALTTLPDGKILIGGFFIAYTQIPRSGIARVNNDGTLDLTFDPPPARATVEYFRVQPNGQILAVGEFGDLSGFRSTMIRLNPDGSQDDSFTCRTDDYGYHINSQPDGKLLLAGFFGRLSTGETRVGIARYLSDGTVDDSFNAVFTRRGGAVTAMARQSDGKIIVGGLFIRSNGHITHNIARFTSDGTYDESFSVGGGPVLSPGYTPISAISVQPDGKILVGGMFEVFNGSDYFGLVRLNSDGSIDPDFALTGVAVGGTTGVRDILVLPDGKILICGDRIVIPGSTASKLVARLNTDGSLDPSFNTDELGNLVGSLGSRMIIQPDGKIIVVGRYNRFPPVPQLIGNIVRLHPDGSTDTSFTPVTSTTSLPPLADAALQPDGKIVVVGYPQDVSGSATMARLNADGTLDAGFVGPLPNGGIRAVELLPNGKILIGGSFTSLDGKPHPHLARISADGTLDDGFVSGLDVALFIYGGVNSILSGPNRQIIVAGGFTAYNGVPRNNLLRLSSGHVAPFDYDGDGRSDISVFRPTTGDWYLQRSADGFTGVNFGAGEDKIAPADYDGDGKTDVAVYRPSTGVWYVSNSSDGTFTVHNFGVSEDLPAPADYDGDGKADICVFRPSTGTWYRLNSGDGEFVVVQFGAEGDKPTIGDFDGDGKSDLAIFRPAEGAWYQAYSSDGTFFGEQFGVSTDRVTPADYDGDGKTDIAIYRPTEGLWYVKNSATSTYTPYLFGIAEDIPVPGDYDGDGKADIGVFRPSNGTWYIANSSDSSYTIYQFGQSGDRPTQSAFGN